MLQHLEKSVIIHFEQTAAVAGAIPLKPWVVRPSRPSSRDDEPRRCLILDQSGLSVLVRALIENFPGPALIANQDRRILEANQKCMELLGLSRDESAGLPVDGVFKSRERNRLIQLLLTDGEGELKLSQGKAVRIRAESVNLGTGRVHLLFFQTPSEATKPDMGRDRNRRRNISLIAGKQIRGEEEENQSFRETLASAVKIELLPTLSKMAREENRKVRMVYKRAVAERLFEVIRDPENPEGAALLSLTPAEMNVCRQIQAGRCTKEIAEFTNSSFETIQTHRKNIRRKLGLTGEKTALYSYLKNLKSLGAPIEAVRGVTHANTGGFRPETVPERKAAG